MAVRAAKAADSSAKTIQFSIIWSRLLICGRKVLAHVDCTIVITICKAVGECGKLPALLNFCRLHVFTAEFQLQKRRIDCAVTTTEL